MIHDRDARRDGRPTIEHSKSQEAGRRRRSRCMCKGSPFMLEARGRQHINMHGSRSTPEAG